MKSTFHGRRRLMRQRGVAGLMAMIFLLVVVSLAAVTLLSMSSSDLHDTTAQNEGITALFAAETGIERASQLYATGTPCSAALLPLPAPAAAMAVGNRASFQSTTVAPVPLVGPVRCQLQVVGRVGNTTRTIQADLASGSNGITFVSASSGAKNNTNPAPLTWNHTIPATAGPNRVLIVGVSIYRATTEQVVGTPTYGGQPLINIGSMNHPTGGKVRVELFLLVNPAIGTNIPITLNLNPSARAQGGAVTLSGVDQITPLDLLPVFGSGSSTTPTVNITTVTNNAWVVDTLGSRLNANATVGGGQTARWNSTTGGGPGNGIRGAGSTEGPKVPAGPVTMNWTLSAAQPWVIGAVALRPGGRVYVMNWQEL